MNFILYYAAISADSIFQAELVRVFGKRDACNARYLFDHYSDDALDNAKRQFLAAMAAWLDYMRSVKP
jgi:hypothetical protein